MLITPHLLLVVCIVLCVFSVNSNHQKPKQSNWCLLSLETFLSIQLLMIIWTAMDVWSPEFITGPYWGNFMEPSSSFLCQIWFPLRLWFIYIMVFKFIHPLILKSGYIYIIIPMETVLILHWKWCKTRTVWVDEEFLTTTKYTAIYEHNYCINVVLV